MRDAATGRYGGAMKPRKRCPRLLFGALLLPTLAWAATSDPAAESALVFEEQLDGKCQILSEGGKLVVLRNAHADRAVRYRLVRMFLGVPQSRVDGEIGPGETPQKLGCNRVNGRKQYWRVERAALVPPEDSP